MQIKLIGDNLDITPDMKETVATKFESKLDRLLQTFAEDLKIGDLKVTKREKYDDFEVNFDMWLPGKKHIFAKNREDNFVTAITGLREEIEKQIKRYKDEISHK
jgi:ribosomal subunit interface protein